jgi:hypothetical protein
MKISSRNALALQFLNLGFSLICVNQTITSSLTSYCLGCGSSCKPSTISRCTKRGACCKLTSLYLFRNNKNSCWRPVNSMMCWNSTTCNRSELFKVYRLELYTWNSINLSCILLKVLTIPLSVLTSCGYRCYCNRPQSPTTIVGVPYISEIYFKYVLLVCR